MGASTVAAGESLCIHTLHMDFRTGFKGKFSVENLSLHGAFLGRARKRRRRRHLYKGHVVGALCLFSDTSAAVKSLWPISEKYRIKGHACPLCIQTHNNICIYLCVCVCVSYTMIMPPVRA